MTYKYRLIKELDNGLLQVEQYNRFYGYSKITLMTKRAYAKVQ